MWWLLTPSNPLKRNNPSPVDERLGVANLLVEHPKIFVTKIENELNTVYTSQTLKLIQIRCPNVRFVWLMGADNMIQFDRMDELEEIVYRVPIGILAKTRSYPGAFKIKLAKAFSSYRLRANQSRDLGNLKAPYWCYKNLPLLNVSSSQIRAS